ncbi:endonuclease/exonuclease/phosphatase [Runella sp. CRIBMP]|uniref:endonuclease/exonuclease/phosphatase family protein n=1 Tax=Runella sp. CRIBMP TaxID=2683261 RepID=UPI001411CE88|nr:endonuclease/exonuclease/phosphatase family protein [Runella sp. CRIBMP]NBB22049.1 endonuclease/exonuclease/phosphatase [Runella sp. CRIBMP]
MKNYAMKSKTPLFWRIQQLFFCFTLLSYTLTYSAITGHWLAGFIMMSLPLLLVIHIVLVGFWLVFSPKRVWLSGLALLLSFPFWARTYGLGPAEEETDSSKTEIKVLSYNVMSFDSYSYLVDKNPQNTNKLIEWVKKEDADVKCFQEFLNHRDRKDLQTVAQLKKEGYSYYVSMQSIQDQGKDYSNGLAIFSKYPIIKQEQMEFSNQNGIIYADINIKGDTIRFISVHLRSMIVRVGGIKLAVKEKNLGLGRYELASTFRKLKGGFVHHEVESKILTDWIEKSPHPVVVCGDFNEVPYSYAYGQVRKRLSNAFEEAGSGFGFTYRKAPGFIRIDNQFYDKKGLEVIDFQTRKDVKYSDHYPIVARYKLL